MTRLFGSQRSTINRTRLTTSVGKHVGGAGHDWIVTSTAGFAAAPIDLYCGLETVRATTAHVATEFNDVTRSRWKSPTIAHRSNDVDVFPEVTDWPTVWRGRIVRLFATFMTSGELAGGAAAARSSAHQIVGILVSVAWSCDGWTL